MATEHHRVVKEDPLYGSGYIATSVFHAVHWIYKRAATQLGDIKTAAGLSLKGKMIYLRFRQGPVNTYYNISLLQYHK